MLHWGYAFGPNFPYRKQVIWGIILMLLATRIFHLVTSQPRGDEDYDRTLLLDHLACELAERLVHDGSLQKRIPLVNLDSGSRGENSIMIRLKVTDPKVGKEGMVQIFSRSFLRGKFCTSKSQRLLIGTLDYIQFVIVGSAEQVLYEDRINGCKDQSSDNG